MTRARWVVAAAVVVGALVAAIAVRSDGPDAVRTFAGDLTAGEYRTARFEPRVALRFDDGWHVRFDRRAGFHVQVGDADDSPAMVVVNSTAARSVEEVIADYHDSASWTAGAITDGPFGDGGRQFDAVAVGGGTPIGIDGQGTFEADAGDRLRIHVGRVAGSTLLAAVVTRPDVFEPFVVRADAVLGSVQPS